MTKSHGLYVSDLGHNPMCQSTGKQYKTTLAYSIITKYLDIHLLRTAARFPQSRKKQNTLLV